ncbi:MAG: metallophosphoesterase [Planctomycetes bacterium]|nr:metallophosphoesterase [Planctomycetota bacterium]
MTRRIFIGDIQGCRAELEELVELVAFDPAQDVLEPVGDLVNRGPDSLGTLRFLRDLGAGGVLGNHDLHLLRVANGLRKRREADTFDDVLAAPDREELLAWLAAKPFAKTWADVILVHGALHPAWRDPLIELAGLDPLTADAKSDFATRARYCASDGVRPERDDPPPPAPFAPWFEHWLAAKRDPRTIVFGHWAMLGLVVRPGLRGLDTGCVWGKQLTAWIAEEDRLVHVPARRRYADFGAN